MPAARMAATWRNRSSGERAATSSCFRIAHPGPATSYRPAGVPAPSVPAPRAGGLHVDPDGHRVKERRHPVEHRLLEPGGRHLTLARVALDDDLVVDDQDGKRARG